MSRTVCRVSMIWGLGLALVAPRVVPAGDDAATLPEPLMHAHSHNDYFRPRPLLDALSRGFASVEADVFLVDGQLLVAHDEVQLRPERSLKALYLEPLREHVAKHRGRVFAGDQRLTLLVDFKTDGAPAYAALSKLLAEYGDMVSGLDEGAWTARAVDVIVTGSRPVEAISADPQRRVAIDGRLADATADAPTSLVPLVSENWRDHFTWGGPGSMPPDERSRLHALVQRAHAQGRRIRFWGAGDRPAIWAEQRAAGVDLLGTDNLSALQEFLQRP